MRMKMRRSSLQDYSGLARAAARALLAVAVVLSISSPGFASNETFHKTYPLSEGGSFLLENVNGSVQVEGWDKDEVEVRAVKTSTNDPQDLERVTIEVVSEPGQVTVRTRYPKGEGVEVAVDYHIHVPYRVLPARSAPSQGVSIALTPDAPEGVVHGAFDLRLHCV